MIEAGKVVELGTHDELYKLNGLYSDLVKLQMSTAEDDKLIQSTSIDKLDEIVEQTVNIRKKSVKKEETEEIVTKIEIPKAEASKLKSKIWALVLPYWYWLSLGLLGAAMVRSINYLFIYSFISSFVCLPAHSFIR